MAQTQIQGGNTMGKESPKTCRVKSVNTSTYERIQTLVRALGMPEEEIIEAAINQLWRTQEQTVKNYITGLFGNTALFDNERRTQTNNTTVCANTSIIENAPITENRSTVQPTETVKIVEVTHGTKNEQEEENKDSEFMV